jgi:photosystem II PsbM protein
VLTAVVVCYRALTQPPASQELGQLANEVNILGVMAVALFILLPVAFLLILFIKSESEGNVSGGFSQEYYDESTKRCGCHGAFRRRRF